jgi:hypothetical protein
MVDQQQSTWAYIHFQNGIVTRDLIINGILIDFYFLFYTYILFYIYIFKHNILKA